MTEHFKIKEFFVTSTGLENVPRSTSVLCEVIENIWYMAIFLEDLRIRVSQLTGRETPIFINSCFRSPAVNKAVKGAKNSYHLKAAAVDVKVPFGYSIYAFNDAIIETCKKRNCRLVEDICHDTFIHFALDHHKPFDDSDVDLPF